MPPFLGIGHPTLGSPGQRGVPGSPGAPCGAPPALTTDICSCSSPPPGPLPSSLTLSPGLLPFSLKSLDCEALDAQARRVSTRLPGVVTLHLWPPSLPRVYTH